MTDLRQQTRDVTDWLSRLGPKQLDRFRQEISRLYANFSPSTQEVLQQPHMTSASADKEVTSITADDTLTEQAKLFWQIHLRPPRDEITRLQLAWRIIALPKLTPLWLTPRPQRFSPPPREHNWIEPIIGGALVMVLLAAAVAAWLFFPSANERPPMRVIPTPRPTLPTTAPAVSRQPAQITPTAQHDIRVFIHHRQEERWAQQVSVYLNDYGFKVIAVRGTPHDIAVPQVRYFYDSDAEQAGDLVVRLGQLYGGRAQLRDFTEYQPKPIPGNVEVWLPTGNEM